MTISQTVVKQYHDSSSSHLRKVGRLTGPSSYATGGDPLTAAQLGMGTIDALLCEPFDNGTVIILAVYQIAAATMKFYDMTGAEIANGTDLSAYNARFEAIGL